MDLRAVPALDVSAAISFATQLFTTARHDEYPGKLVESLQKLAPFDIFSVTVFAPDTNAVLLDNNLEAFVPRRVIENFLAGTYLLDAVYTACCANVPAGLYRLSDLAPDNYFASDFYNSADFHPCVSDKAGSLAEEIVYMTRPFGEDYLVLSLMRRTSRSNFSAEEFAALKAVEPVVMETMSQHWGNSVARLRNRAKSPTAMLDKAFSTFASDRLSPREQTIAGLLLRGHSTLSVAHTLGIAEGTAKVHRKNIYDKLGISSQSQMFLMFCNYIVNNPELTSPSDRDEG